MQSMALLRQFRKMTKRVLHILSQRPRLTGSGITLDSLVRLAEIRGWDQHVIVGVPREGDSARVADLSAERVHPLWFQDGELDFPVPGMSDVMPYQSTRFSSMTDEQVETYKRAWIRHIGDVASRMEPDIIHSHHAWIMSSLLKDVLPNTPVVTHCHATGLRQMNLAPRLKNDVINGLKRNDRFLVVREDDGTELARVLGISREKIRLVGAGYNGAIFHTRGRCPVPRRLVYVGKLSKAKGLPWLLDAVQEIARDIPDVELHVVGAGAGKESESIEHRLHGMGPTVRYWGQLSQVELADLLRTAALCVLPSFYEGVPLVLVEALACGCRLVATGLKGVESELRPHLGAAMDLIPLPLLVGIDRIDPSAEAGFVRSLKAVLIKALGEPPLDVAEPAFAEALRPFSWNAVFERVEAVWNEHTSCVTS